MRCDANSSCLIATLLVLISSPCSHATEFPLNHWQVEGSIQSWPGKHPVPQARILVFFDGAARTCSRAHADCQDYPALPASGEDGRFRALATSYATPEGPKRKPDRVEVIVLALGYHSERREFPASEITFVEEGEDRKVLIPDIYLHRSPPE